MTTVLLLLCTIFLSHGEGATIISLLLTSIPTRFALTTPSRAVGCVSPRKTAGHPKTVPFKTILPVSRRSTTKRSNSVCIWPANDTGSYNSILLHLKRALTRQPEIDGIQRVYQKNLGGIRYSLRIDLFIPAHRTADTIRYLRSYRYHVGTYFVSYLKKKKKKKRKLLTPKS